MILKLEDLLHAQVIYAHLALFLVTVRSTLVPKQSYRTPHEAQGASASQRGLEPSNSYFASQEKPMPSQIFG